MTETALKVGQPVKLVGKDVVGTVAFVGATKFAPGKWIGVVLEEACGRNNGTVESVIYFKCEEKHGLFVRQTQLEVVGDDAQGTVSTPAATPTAPRSSTGKRRIEPTSLRRKPQGNPVPQKPDRLRLPIAGGGSSSGLSSIRRTPSSSTGWRQSDTDLAHARQLTPGSKEASPRDVTTRMSASFVEAGFVESRTASIFSSGRTEERVSSQELDNLHAEVKDVTEKLETLRIKRAQDKEKLKEAEKLRLLVEQHSEFKSRIMESQAALQRELVAARNEAREASESRQQTVSDTQDLADTVEMLTLDKEMAEERAETLQLELEQARETIEELTVDLEILKEAAGGDVPVRTGAGEEVGGATLVQVKQLEQQNQRLHDTLVKMRDVAAHEKHELQKASREAEARRTELSAAARAREVLDQQLIETRAIIADLQEQVDAALGAEDMVETLTERNLELEEHMLELEEQVRDLEDINYTNDLLVEGAKEQELELREDLDLSMARLRETERERDALGAVLVDRDATIAKFRELVQTMTEQNTRLRADLTAATNRPVGTPSEVIDFKKLFSETKAHSAAIDLELRELELQQARDNVTYLKQYLPDNFMTRGGDQDSVSVLLLLPRVIWKAEVVLGGAAKFPPPDAIDRATVLRSHQTDQYAFACRLRYLLHSIQSCVYQLQHVATRGTVLQLLALGGLYSELAGHERALDQYVELLRKDQLDENVGLDVLERAVSSLAALQRTQLSGSELQQALLLSHLSRAAAAAAEAADINTKRLAALLQTGCEGEAGVFCSSVSQCCLEVMSAVKRVKRRLPQDGSAGPVTLPEEVQERLQALAPDTARAAAVMRHVVRAALQQMTEGSEGIPGQKVVELIHEATDALYGAEDQGPESVCGTLQATQLHIASIASSLENGEFDYDGTPSSYDNATPPIVLRAQHIKAELKDTEHIKNKLELREQDLRELRLLLKQKNESLSEMTVRRDLAEKRVVTATKDADVTIEKLQRHLDDTMLLLRRKEKEYEETLDHLQSDIESLESEKGELREKLKAIKKRSLYDAAEERNTSLLGTGNSQLVSAGAAVQDSPALLQQISDLRIALRCAASAATRDTASKMRRQLAQLPPIAVCRVSAEEEKRDLGKEDGAGEAATSKHSSDTLNTLAQQTARLKKELAAIVSNSCVVELSGHGGSSVRQLQKQRSAMAAYSATVAALQDEVVRAVARQRPGGAVYAALRPFPSSELTKARAQQAPLAQVGQLTVAGDSSEVVPVVVQPQHIHLLHSRLLS